jgi:UDP-N-acetylmuramoyl-L-alanyl-D-glutamate--2,6-diaminopimelate ligase
VTSENNKLFTLKGLELISGDSEDTEIFGLAVNSQDVGSGYLFIALQGSVQHGAYYSQQAIKNGANAILTDEKGYKIICETEGICEIPVIVLPEPRLSLSKLAKKFWDKQPEVLVAVTGTNGKTSVANFTRQLWSYLGFSSASIGTIGVEGDYSESVQHTTPEPLTLHSLLNKMSEKGVSHCALEASSHGLKQYRLDSVKLKAAAFTNFSHDHLDYHSDFKEYFEAKMSLFERVLEHDGTAVIYSDDKKSSDVKRRSEERGLKIFSVGAGEENDLKILRIKSDETGQTIRCKFESSVYQSRIGLVGSFQAQNVLLAVGFMIVCGADIVSVFKFLPQLTSVPGRMQLAGARLNGAPVFVDYAHTPDALETALRALRPHVMGHLVVVFGAGGDRDKEKRKIMGRIADNYADIIYVTDDNPRSESPENIRRAILIGCKRGIEIGDRAKAILISIEQLKQGDALLIAGKGHEANQIIGDTIFPFNDVEQASMAIEALENGSM